MLIVRGRDTTLGPVQVAACQQVVVVRANAGQVDSGFDAEGPQLIGRPNPDTINSVGEPMVPAERITARSAGKV